MKSFDVYFEIFNKKLKTTVEADTMSEATQKVKDSIVFHKIEPTPPKSSTPPPRPNPDMKQMKDMFGDLFGNSVSNPFRKF